ncbi:hypothetical protein [Chryseobacterium sp. BLS98]|uniref:hypothetical protein n=1 Tax=Chryseobacterium sp. BLS98 TaxID=885586 RepID=UPI00065AC844|nr:hypothetical protein [Chryseobacterium sp. BLS98]
MKKILLFALVSFSNFYFSQSWNIQGNAGTNPATDFIGTTDNKDLVFRTNNAERFKIADGRMFFNINTIDGDGIDIIDNTPNKNSGTDVVWIKSVHPQSNDVGLLTISTSNWLYPIFSARENGKILMGVNAYNVSLSSCSDCSNYRLFVKDGIKTEKVKVDVASANGWADYVFKKDYKLNSLEYVEKHIEEKGHLPNIPSAKEVVENGINLGEMNAKLLEKIEELTLYVIKLNKDFKKLEEENNKLRNNSSLAQ